MNPFRSVLAAAVLGLASPAHGQTPPPTAPRKTFAVEREEPAPAAVPARASRRKPDPLAGKIKPEWIESAIRFLSDDLLRGRETGQPGAELAAKFVAAGFESAGLVPVAGFSDYLMPVPLRYSTLAPNGASASLSGPQGEIPLELGQDYFVHPDKQRPRGRFRGDVVFVGWGVTAPELGYDDYRGVDVRGKVVAMIFGGPPSLPPDERGHFAGFAMKEANALRRGAVGVITLLPAPAKQVAKIDQLEGFGWTDSAGVAHSPFFESGAAIRLTDTGTDKLFTAAGVTFDSLFRAAGRGEVSLPLRVAFSFDGEFRHRPVVAHNAIGMVEGSDPALKKEYVVYTAHLDHVGVGEPVDGDSVYHGAIDNGGGTAVVMALARAFAGLPRPKRSVIFMAVTGEEKGILGSDYFAWNPPVPIGSIVANVNLDNAVLLAPLKDLVAYGAGYSTLGDLSNEVLRRVGLQPSVDPLPAMTIFTRSDHYSFMQAGVPGVMFFPGKTLTKEQQAYFGRVHHTPRDRFDQGIDWNAAVTYATANLMMGYEVANRPQRPRWKGRFFFHRNPIAPGASY